MNPLKRVAFIGNHLPRRCGIATFTHELHRAVASARPDVETCVVAMTDAGRAYVYPPAVRIQINDDALGDYADAAEFLNAGGFDVVSLQHEYGIFGGEAGAYITELLARLDMPIVSTLHTVLPQPTPAQHGVMARIIETSTKLIVMSEKGRELLPAVHGVPATKIEVIPHGIPEFPFLETHQVKAKFGFVGKTVILTFGLLSPNKGIEIMLDAMPAIIESCPNATYVILGATHPNLVRDDGEAYREALTARVHQLGIEDHVVFFDQFVDQATLLDFISMSDVYVTPYLNEAQMTSGTLSYSFGLGKAVVSTPYWHAKELLAGGRGILVPFGDAKTMGVEIAALLTNDVRRHAMRKGAYEASRSMTWEQTAERYLTSFEGARRRVPPARLVAAIRPVSSGKERPVPEIRLDHFLSMCDATGMLQHAVHSVADRAHGYCIDDNARALLFSSELAASGEAKLPDTVTARFAAFIQHAWNADARRFRNFMSYDRRWLEDVGSEDSHARTLWALAECARKDPDWSRRKWAVSLFKIAFPEVENFSSPRAWAFTLLALDAYCPVAKDDLLANRMRELLASRLLSMFSAREPKHWLWFENVLAYDNARLPQALLQTGMTTNTAAYVESGLRSLRWLMSLQSAPSGCFRPVGTASFGMLRQKPKAFDQQPVEAAATISACLAAARAEGSAEWPAAAMRAFNWYLGENDLQTTLIDPDTGSCADGLHPDRANENKGAESVLSYLLGLVEIRQLNRASMNDLAKSASKRARNADIRSVAPRTSPGGHIVSLTILEPSDPASPPKSSQGRGQTVQACD